MALRAEARAHAAVWASGRQPREHAVSAKETHRRAIVAEPVAPRRGRPRLVEPSAEYLEKQAEIVEAAAKVFAAKGYDVATLNDIAAELGLHKTSLYHYVRSKAELLYLIFQGALDRGLARVDEMAQIDDPKERLAGLIRFQVLEVVLPETMIFRVFVDDRPRLAPVYEKAIRAREKLYFSFFSSSVKAAIDAGALPALDPRYATQAIVGMTSWIYKWFNPRKDDPYEYAETCVQLVLAHCLAGTSGSQIAR
ncbi:MAG: TetR/AcrR family transcriptional regulator [Actinomycetota bacterium]